MHGWRRMWMVGAVIGAATTVTGTGAPTQAIVEDPQLVPADAETEPVLNSGDAADDPAIWVHPTDPERSLVIGNDKQGALEVYGLDGARRQRITTTTSFWGNVDVRQGVTIGDRTLDVVASQNAGLRLFTVDPATRTLELVTDGNGAIATFGEGLCLYDSVVTGNLSAIVITRAGRVRQYEIHDSDNDGLLEGTVVRQFEVGSESEGCVADDDNGALYISEESVGLWRYGAEPTAGAARTAVDTVQPSGRLAADVEGVTLVDEPDGSGYLVASSQNAADTSKNYYVMYDRLSNAYVKSFRIVDGTADGCTRTDGIAATTAPLGPAFPRGVFICQDNDNEEPGSIGNQNFKLTRLENVIELAEEPPPQSALSFVGADSTNINAKRHTVQVPATVQAGDTLLLFFAGNQNPPTTSPPPGWTLVQSADPTGIRGRLWSRTATAGDAGSSVTVTSSTIVKADLTVGAYRGASPGPIDVSAVAVDTVTSSTHVAPSVTPSADGGWLVSYWADKSTSSTSLSTPSSLARRSGSTGTGGGHITSLLADSDGAVHAGPTGGQAANGTAPASKAVMFSLVLRTTMAATNQPPSASFTVSCVGLSCSFDSTGSHDPDGSIASYDWQFGDGTGADGASPSHTYASAGARTVALTVTDNEGASDSTTRQANPATTPPASSFLWGASVQPSQTNMSTLESQIGRPVDWTRIFLRWDSVLPESYHTWLIDSGRTLAISVRPERSDGTVIRWADIAAAQPGDALHAEMLQWADRIGALGVPVFFTLNHEPEAAINNLRGTSSDYVAAWRRIVDIFRARGIVNADFLWITTAYSFRLPSGDARFGPKWYPGDGHVDAMAVDAYNWYNCRAGVNTAWMSLETLIEDFRDFGAQHPDKALYLAEWASTEDTARPGRKAQWIADAQALFKDPAYAQFDGIAYFNIRGQGNCSWYVTSSQSALDAFTAMGQDPFYVGEQ